MLDDGFDDADDLQGDRGHHLRDVPERREETETVFTVEEEQPSGS